MSSFVDHDLPDEGHRHQLSKRQAILRVLLFLRLAARLRRGLPVASVMRFRADDDE